MARPPPRLRACPGGWRGPGPWSLNGQPARSGPRGGQGLLTAHQADGPIGPELQVTASEALDSDRECRSRRGGCFPGRTGRLCPRRLLLLFSGSPLDGAREPGTACPPPPPRLPQDDSDHRARLTECSWGVTTWSRDGTELRPQGAGGGRQSEPPQPSGAALDLGGPLWPHRPPAAIGTL